MTFAELVTELQARGFSLTDARAGRYINWARAELDELYPWPYREASATGTAPLTITDLGKVEAVTDTGRDVRLKKAEYTTLLDWYGDLEQTGNAEWYYEAWPSGVPVVATYPGSAATIGVQYWKVTPDISGAEEPAAPERFHGLVVDLAARRAYRDRDDHGAAQALQQDIDRQVAQMAEALLGGIRLREPQYRQALTFTAQDW